MSALHRREIYSNPSLLFAELLKLSAFGSSIIVVNTVNEKGLSPLHIAIEESSSCICYKYLLDFGANINQTTEDWEKNTVLHTLVSTAGAITNPEVVNFFIAQAGHLINQVNSCGHTPLVTYLYRNRHILDSVPTASLFISTSGTMMTRTPLRHLIINWDTFHAFKCKKSILAYAKLFLENGDIPGPTEWFESIDKPYLLKLFMEWGLSEHVPNQLLQRAFLDYQNIQEFENDNGKQLVLFEKSIKLLLSRPRPRPRSRPRPDDDDDDETVPVWNFSPKHFEYVKKRQTFEKRRELLYLYLA